MNKNPMKKGKLILPETKANLQSYIHMDWMLPQAAQETRSFNQQSIGFLKSHIGFLKSHRYIVQTSVRQFLSFMKNSQFWFLKEVETVLVSHKNLESGS